jgi:prepilin-type processing-associated H-X9-DG protein
MVLCVVLLLSSLAAVGGQGRMRAKEMVCLANLRQWHAVFEDYLQANNGKFFTGIRSMPYWWPIQLDEATQSWKKNRTWFCPTTTRPLIDEDGNHVSRFDIFSAWGIFSQESLGGLGPDGLAGSYGLNGYLLDPDVGTPSVFGNGIQVDNFWRTPHVEGASQIPLMFGALRFDLWPLHTDAPASQELAAWSGNHMARSCVNRHNGVVNCLFADGAARKVGLKELWTLKWHKSFNVEGPWTKAGGGLPSDWPKWMRGFKDY